MKPKKIILILAGIILIGATVASAYFLYRLKEGSAVGGPTQNTDPSAISADYPSGTIKIVDLFSGTSTPATSTPVRIFGAKKVTLALTADGGTVGGKFLVLVNRNATTTNQAVDSAYRQFNKLISDVSNTNAQQLTRLDSVNLNVATTTIASMDLQYDTFSHLKCALYETADGGTYSCKAIIEY